MQQFEFFLTSSLEKVFPTQRPPALAEGWELSVLQGERPAVQLVYTKHAPSAPSASGMPFALTVEGGPIPARLREVKLLPSDLPCYESNDSGYITTEPGLFPDLLVPLKTARVVPVLNQYRAVWIDFPALSGVEPGRYTITVHCEAVPEMALLSGVSQRFSGMSGCRFSLTFTLRVLAAALPPQRLIHNEWFYSDCLASYYGVPALGEEHWRIIENFIAPLSPDYGINALLTPVFTPPLDTAVGGQRLTVQLVDVFLEGGAYRFGFEKLARWCSLCQRHGIEYLQIAHLYTQWGARATPKIMATVDGEEKQLFGWHVPAVCNEYRAFLEAFIPALRRELERLGYSSEKLLFHISDEPTPEHMEHYKAAKAQVADLLEGCIVLDALSDYAFYAEGAVEKPISANDHIQPFLDANVPGLWVYYCCGQCRRVPNRFYALPSARNRIMGTLMYLHDIEGFLHWGYNFYNSQYSLASIDPYFDTSASGAFPSGDAYLVYPAPDGTPYSSIRGEVLRQGLDDLRALQLLERLAGRAAAEALVRQGVQGAFTFRDYPEGAAYLLDLRARVNAAIEEKTTGHRA